MSLDTTYQPDQIEKKWYDYWQKQGLFSPDHSASNDDAYCIMIPPPNVTGSLHMGHAFQHTIMDALIRYQRMSGKKTLWQPGTDHAGIATQMVVERLINAEGKTRHDYGREAFIDRIWQWKQQSGGTISAQMQRIGNSLDWDNERFTMDEGLSDAVTEVFVRLFDEGIIYRGKRLVNWDPVLHTAVSDLEVLSEDEQGFMWHIRYPLSDGSGELVVATTRPETMLGDAAVAVHPDDARYQQYIGRTIDLPLTGRKIPIVADDYVDPEFGSGCVKITPAHDFNDYQVWLRHRHNDAIKAQLDGGLINIFDINAAIRTHDDEPNLVHIIPAKYCGLAREQARKAIVDDLTASDLLQKTEPHQLKIPRGDRTNAVIEPYLTDQWYVDLTRDVQGDGRPGGKQVITDPAIEVVRDGRIEFIPENWSKTYYQWLENIEDWCISRQIWWGHRVPAWYDDDGNIYVARDEVEVRKKYQLGDEVALRQDEDVLDTWFSSALWPFSTLGWPEKTERLQTFYPNSVLVTGFDIIFFWVARMIMMGQKFLGDVPFEKVFITGLVRDANGHKMSKSKGNVLDPIDIIDGIDLETLVEKKQQGMMQQHLADKVVAQTRKDFPDGIPAFGTDALRFTFAALSTNGRDIRFDLSRVEGYRNFCNKLWNASRFVLMQLENHGFDRDANAELSPADRWILARLDDAVTKVHEGYAQYRFDFVARTLYEFIWHEYCDWYLELTKVSLNNDNAALRNGALSTLVDVLETVLRLAHPVIPFITEEIWQKILPYAGVKGDSVMVQAYPMPSSQHNDAEAEQQIEWLKEFTLIIRQIKAEMNIAPGRMVNVLVENATKRDVACIDSLQPYLTSLVKVEQVSMLDGKETKNCAFGQLGSMQLYVPLQGLVDISAEVTRLEAVLAKMQAELKRLEGKLSNDKFVNNAPADVVAKERQKYQDVLNIQQETEEQLVALKAM